MFTPLKEFHIDSEGLFKEDKIEKINMYKNDIQELFIIYGYNIVLSSINPIVEIDRTDNIFLTSSLKKFLNIVRTQF